MTTSIWRAARTGCLKARSSSLTDWRLTRNTVVSSPAPTGPADSATVDAINATGRGGQAAAVQRALANTGFLPGAASTGTQRRTRSVIYYRPGGSTGAAAAATLLGALPVESDPSVEVGHLRVVLGSDFTMPAASAVLDRPESPGSASGPAGGNSTQSGTDAITPDSMSGGGILRCLDSMQARARVDRVHKTSADDRWRRRSRDPTSFTTTQCDHYNVSLMNVEVPATMVNTV